MSYEKIIQSCGADAALLEGSLYRRRNDGARNAIRNALSPRERPWPPVPFDEPMSRDDFAETLRGPGGGAGNTGWAVAFSHDHYPTVSGGAQNCLNDEEAALSGAGWAYLHFCPARALPMLSDPVAPDAMRLVASLNGERLGMVTMADVEAVFSRLGLDRRQPVFIIHHLLGHDPGLIARLVMLCPGARTYFWAHDLFALCPSVHLLRNDATFCGAPPIGSGACGVCAAGEERADHHSRVKAFLAASNPTVLAPSETVLALWRRHMDFSGPSRVIAPCGVAFDEIVPPKPSNQPLRVGFLGTKRYGKGWDAFESLARWHQGDERYEFLQLGTEDAGAPNVVHIHAQVSRGDRHAMARAVRDAGLDVAINWSLYYESFSFTAIEALAGGAFVVARKGAGNVWPLIEAMGAGQGIALDTETELQAMFIDGAIGRRVAAADRRRGALVLGRGAGAILSPETGDA